MIVVSEFMDPEAVRKMEAATQVVYDPGLVDAPDDLIQALGDATALVVRNRTQVSEALLAAAPNLKCVGRLGVGLDNIDLDACATRGVEVYPAIGANNLSVAEYVLGTAMALLRGAYSANNRMMSGDWPRQDCAGRELSGKVLGLVGLGSIARDTAERAIALGMEVAAFDPFVDADDPIWHSVGPLDLDRLLQTADVVSLHVPLVDATRHLINADRLVAMKSDAILINAARGGVVDDTALAAALKAGEIGGAALDVFETEPLTQDAARVFQDAPNLILTPHIAGVTVESNVRVSGLIAERVLAHLDLN